MSTFLFDKAVFGPVSSRRLGLSLGVNLLPLNYKLCTFDCVYCECGWTVKSHDKIKLITPKELTAELDSKLISLKEANTPIDTITFAGNGEPTLHKDFPEIVASVLQSRDQFYPKAKVAVLSNGLLMSKNEIRNTMNTVDQPIVKLDSAINTTFKILNRPSADVSIEEIINNYRNMKGKLIIQSMIVAGEQDGETFDNSNNQEVKALIEALKLIKPREVMLYSLDRDTPGQKLRKITFEKLSDIAKQIKNEGVNVSVY